MSSVKTKSVRNSGNEDIFSAKLCIVQEALLWEGHLLPSPLSTKYLITKYKYLEAKLGNAFCYTQQTTFFIKVSEVSCFSEVGCSYFFPFG